MSAISDIRDKDLPQWTNAEKCFVELWEQMGFEDMAEQAAADNAAMTERIAEYENAYKKIMAEECAPDEVHCTCVPALKIRITKLEAMSARIADLESLLIEFRDNPNIGLGEKGFEKIDEALK